MTLYSYVASERAFRAAVEAEAGALADDMRQRMGTVTADLGDRMAKLGDTPMAANVAADDGFDQEDMARLERQVEQAVGAAAGLVESFEVLPEPPEPPEPPDVDADTPPGGPPVNAGVRAQIAEARRQARQAAEEIRRGYQERGRSERAREHAASRARVVMRREFGFPLRRHGRKVGTVRANLGTDRLLKDVLGSGGHRPGEIPFAIDAAGNVHAADSDLPQLRGLSLLPAAAGPAAARQTLPDWIVVTRRDPESGLTMGVALQKELEMGRRIQEEMLPRDPLRVAFAEVKGVSIPAREVGGDFFNYFTLPSGEAALLVGDVSGKGVAAALLMANLQATLRARLPLERDLQALADDLDHEIAATTGGGAYLTLFMSVLDPAGAMRYVNAGHHAPFVLHADGRIESLDSTGRPLGLLAGGGYVEERVALEPGSSLFLYTDGVVESEDASGEPFGVERLQALIVRERMSGLDGILTRVEEAVRAYRAGAEAADDATMVVLKVGGPPTASPA